MQIPVCPRNTVSYSSPRFRGVPLPPQQRPEIAPNKSDLTAWYEKLQKKYQYKDKDVLTPLLLLMVQPDASTANIDLLKNRVVTVKDTEDVLSYFIENLVKDKILQKTSEGNYQFTPIAQHLIRKLRPSDTQETTRIPSATVMNTIRYTTASAVIGAFSMIGAVIGISKGIVNLRSAVGISAAVVALFLGGTSIDTLRLALKHFKDRKQSL